MMRGLRPSTPAQIIQVRLAMKYAGVKTKVAGIRILAAPPLRATIAGV